MIIRIAGRIHPFSHQPGTLCLLPQSHLKVQVFPARVNFFDLKSSNPIFYLLFTIQGPVKDFTIEMDLEHLCIKVFGMTVSGPLRYSLRRESDKVSLHVEKTPQDRLSCQLSSSQEIYQLAKGETVLISRKWTDEIEVLDCHRPQMLERLSLGMHKSQDWDLIKRRCDLREIFPIWLRLGQVTPSSFPTLSTKGNFELLQHCEEIVEGNLKLAIVGAFTKLFLASCEGICVPRLVDTDHQGITAFEDMHQDGSELVILKRAAQLIRALFLGEENDILSLLPHLPPDFHSGRMVQAQTSCGDLIHFEWTKKQLRRVILHSHSERVAHLKLPASIRKCRVRTSFKEKGKEYSLKESLLLLPLHFNRTFFIDRFQK